MSTEEQHDGRVPASGTLARVTLRPIGSSLPLGALALVPAGLLLAGAQLGWFSLHDQKLVPFVLLGFAVPLQFVSSVFAFLGRDSLVGTGFGLFTGTWLAYSLASLSGAPGQTSHVLGGLLSLRGSGVCRLDRRWPGRRQSGGGSGHPDGIGTVCALRAL